MGKVTVQKDNLVAQLADEMGETKSFMRSTCENLIRIIRTHLVAGDDVRIHGLGTFRADDVPEHAGVNPRTREPIVIPAMKHVKFSPSKSLKEAVRRT